MLEPVTRRDFLHQSIALGASATGIHSLEEKTLIRALEQGANAEKQNEAPLEPLPMGRLGKYPVSRVLFGGNLLSSWVHSRDLLYVSRLAKKYVTEPKVFDTLELAESSGINTVTIDMVQLEMVNKYKKTRNEKIQTLVCILPDRDQWFPPSWELLKTNIDKTIDQGPTLMFIQGGYCDRLVEWGYQKKCDLKANVELIGKIIGYIREKGFQVGLASHSLIVPMECDKLGITPDFYFKSFHHDQYWSATPRESRKPFCVDGERFIEHNEFHDNIYCINPEETAEYMKKKEQPWVAFKTLAAGAIAPKSGLQYAFENGADFVTLGMFDFHVVENVKTALAVLTNLKSRERPWRA